MCRICAAYSPDGRGSRSDVQAAQEARSSPRAGPVGRPRPQRPRPAEAEPLLGDGAHGLGEPAPSEVRLGHPVARASATAARSASPASTTGRSTASICARRASTCCSSTRCGALDPERLADVEALRELDGAALRELGRLGLPDAPASRRARLPPHHLGRGARRSQPTRIRATSAATAIALLPDRPRPHQRGLLRGPEGGALPGHQQHRQRGAHLPRAVDRGAQGQPRRGRDDLLATRT